LLVHVVLIARATWYARANAGILARPAYGLTALLALQLSLGAGTWVVKYGWPKWLGEHAWTAGYTVQREDLVSSMIVTGHVAIGSLILATSVLLAMRAFRYLQADRPQFSSLHTLSMEVVA
jgi:heme a synthase